MGGKASMTGGEAKGGNPVDVGGAVELIGGNSDGGISGEVLVRSGASTSASSGDVKLQTADAGAAGISFSNDASPARTARS